MSLRINLNELVAPNSKHSASTRAYQHKFYQYLYKRTRLLSRDRDLYFRMKFIKERLNQSWEGILDDKI